MCVCKDENTCETGLNLRSGHVCKLSADWFDFDGLPNGKRPIKQVVLNMFCLFVNKLSVRYFHDASKNKSCLQLNDRQQMLKNLVNFCQDTLFQNICILWTHQKKR